MFKTEVTASLICDICGEKKSTTWTQHIVGHTINLTYLAKNQPEFYRSIVDEGWKKVGKGVVCSSFFNGNTTHVDVFDVCPSCLPKVDYAPASANS